MTSIASKMMIDYTSKVCVASSPFWVVQLQIMSPKVGQCHLPLASEVGVASSLLQGYVHAMTSWNFKVLLVSPCIFKVLIGTLCIFNILLASLKSWCLAIVLYAFDVWAMLPLKIALWLHEYCHDFDEWSVDVALWQRWMLAWSRYRCNVGMVSARMKCWHDKNEYWHDFYANEVSTWLHECCHDFDEWSVDVALWQRWMLAWPRYRCNVGMVSVRMKCWLIKMNVGMTSVQI